ncbi:hypothetical protein ES703_84186 [subsurface metagenome]
MNLSWKSSILLETADTIALNTERLIRQVRSLSIPRSSKFPIRNNILKRTIQREKALRNSSLT